MTTDKLKLRFRATGDKSWRYVKTLSKNGLIMSSTTNPANAVEFTESEIKPARKQMSNPDGPYKKTDIEAF